MNRSKIFMLCSWLDHKSTIGIFFREQAKILSEDFEFTLATLREEPIGFRSFLKKKKLSKVEKHISTEGLPVYYLEFYYFWFLGSYFKENFKKRALKKFFKSLNEQEGRINLIHAQSLFKAGYWAYWIHEMFKIPYILTEHNQISFYGLKTDERVLVDKVFLNSQKNLVVSFDKIRQFAANGVYADFVPIGNFVDEQRFHYAEEHPKKENNFAFSTIGAFSLIKDQTTLLKAIEIVASRNPERSFAFNWVGFDAWGGDSRDKVEQLLTDYTLPNLSIHLLATAERDHVAELLQATDLFLFSSISEGMPVSVLEALACGVPVVTTRCGGVDEIIDESNGRMVQIKDYEGMADFIEKVILGDITFDRKKISASAIEKFGSEAFRQKMKKIYEEAISKQDIDLDSVS